MSIAKTAQLELMRTSYHVDWNRYFSSSVAASFCLHHIGLRLTLLLAAGFLSLGSLVLALAPPFPVFICSLSSLGFGAGMYDAAITTVVSHE